MANLKNINLMSQDTFNNIEQVDDELYAVSGSGIGFPSDKFDDLTLGASGTEYTAPANGWFTINKHGAAGQLTAFENINAGGVTWITCLGAETDCRLSCPAKKGDNVVLWYTASGATNFFRFVYAEGE